jgi:propionyl-CoA carboxylase alpha chain
MRHPRFQAGEAVTTAFIAEEYPDGFHGNPTDDATRDALVAVAAVLHATAAERAQLIDGQLNGHGAAFGTDWVVQLGGTDHAVNIEDAGGGFAVSIDGAEHMLSTEWRVGEALLHGRFDRRDIAVAVDALPVGYRLTTAGASHVVRILTPRAAELARHMIAKIPPDLSRFLLCPMPGLIVKLDVSVGDKVEAGQPLATVEAMKMENILRAEKSATIKEVRVKAGDSLAVDAVILEFEA